MVRSWPRRESRFLSSTWPRAPHLAALHHAPTTAQPALLGPPPQGPPYTPSLGQGTGRIGVTPCVPLVAGGSRGQARLARQSSLRGTHTSRVAPPHRRTCLYRPGLGKATYRSPLPLGVSLFVYSVYCLSILSTLVIYCHCLSWGFLGGYPVDTMTK